MYFVIFQAFLYIRVFRIIMTSIFALENSLEILLIRFLSILFK